MRPVASAAPSLVDCRHARARDHAGGRRLHGLGHARPLTTPGVDETRRFVRAFVECCYADLGKKPRLLDAEDLAQALARGVPARLRARDPLAEHAEAILRAFYGHLEESEVVPQAFEIRQALEPAVADLRAVVAAGELAGRAGPAPAPFVHGAAKLGRNDPCSCGSGKKFKKCHGREA